jgi:hypothetical protein
METTFDKFIKSDPKAKELFDKEYNELLLSEYVLEKMQKDKLSEKALAQIAGVSPIVIRNIKNNLTDKINFRAFSNVLYSVGYRINIEKM